MYAYMDRLHLLIWYSVQFLIVGIYVTDLPRLIFDVILFLLKEQVHSWIWYILKSLFGRNLFSRSLSVLVDARTSFLFLYHSKSERLFCQPSCQTLVRFLAVSLAFPVCGGCCFTASCRLCSVAWVYNSTELLSCQHILW